jgi:putative MFS transporter
MLQKSGFRHALNTTVMVAALGYFVDVFDLVLVLIVGKSSLADLGFALGSEENISRFQYLLDIQMIGMLLGGLFWGILGDKKGRLSVLFGSILLYSVANILNGMVGLLPGHMGQENILHVYAIIRFVAGFGLAGELGAGITLVSEIMNKENRGYGTMIVAAVGVTGAVAAALVANIGWELAYYVGGVMGLSLLFLRIRVFESGMFEQTRQSASRMGHFIHLLMNRSLRMRYVYCILIGLPVWFIIGILIGRAPEFAKAMNISGTINQGLSVMLCYSGLVFGDISSGVLSQWLKSRRMVFYIFYALAAVLIVVYLNAFGMSTTVLYTLLFLMGFSVGFWAVFVTMAAEQFGTNLRATVSTTAPNFVRGSLVPLAALFDWLRLEWGMLPAAYALSAFVLLVATFAVTRLSEPFGKDLDYVEHMP